MTRNTISSHRASASAAPSRRTSRSFWFESQDSSLYGPLPTGWRPISASLLPPPNAAAQTIGIAKFNMRSAYGFENRMRTVAGSGVSIAATSSKAARQVGAAIFGSRTRSIVKRTSSEVTGAPPSHAYFGSRWNSKVRPSGLTDQDRASDGTG